MISRNNRFQGLGSLNYLFRSGRTVRVEFLALRFVHGKNEDYRLSVIVSKKVSKSAVVRNRIRRRIYESVRLVRKSQGQNWPVDMAITVFDESLAKMPSTQLNKLVLQLLQKSGVL